MKIISGILALLALACLVLAIWAPEHNISRVEQTRNADTRLGGSSR